MYDCSSGYLHLRLRASSFRFAKATDRGYIFDIKFEFGINTVHNYTWVTPIIWGNGDEGSHQINSLKDYLGRGNTVATWNHGQVHVHFTTHRPTAELF